MDTKIQFQKNANIITTNGQSLGQIDRVVLNPATKVITDIVVRQGTLFNKEDRVIPIDFVVETTEENIVLREDVGELDAFPPFEERRVVSESTDIDRKLSSGNSPQPVNYGFPEVGPSFVKPPSEQFVTRIEKNIPEGTVAMKEGARVITAEGKHVGSVERVLADASIDQITHLLISNGTFTKTAKLIPIKWVMVMGEDEVHLRVKSNSVEELDATSMAV